MFKRGVFLQVRWIPVNLFSALVLVCVLIPASIGYSQQPDAPPAIDPIGPQSVCLGEQVTIVVSATDPDGDSLFWSFSGLPAGATFVDNGDGTGTFTWTPTELGTFCVTFHVTDGILTDSESVCITVLDCDNRPPVIDPIGPQTVCLGEQVTIVISATDPDGDPLFWSFSGLPAGATFVDNGDGTGTFTWTPTALGTFCITFSVTDGVHQISVLVCIYVVSDACCCIDRRGDVNGDGDDADILDLTYLVDYIFRGGQIPGCPKEADVNSDRTPSNILDLTFLVDIIFRNGPMPGPCP